MPGDSLAPWVQASPHPPHPQARRGPHFTLVLCQTSAANIQESDAYFFLPMMSMSWIRIAKAGLVVRSSSSAISSKSVLTRARASSVVRGTPGTTLYPRLRLKIRLPTSVALFSRS